MSTSLRKDLRNDLEKVIIAARQLAEEAATQALKALSIGEKSPFSHLSPPDKALRNRLRARGRAAGDTLNSDGTQTITHLAELVAYEHWHRMLFARFLAENDLLLEPEYQVALSLDDIEEIAREDQRNLWDLAGSYAQKMLPGVFRNDDAALEVSLAPENRASLEKLLASLDPAVFTAGDSLGWTYQFWQTQRKEDVNKSGVKIGANELSPVTQLFTEDYMVEFLLHNTLGAWWAGKLGPIEAASEEEARAKAALPERDGIAVTWTYLRFIQDGETQTWKPAAGTFEGWPDAAKDITFLDPCMGSGHFPVFALPILARLRMEEENLNAAEAVHAVLRDNIHGLELDPRCCQIGAFNLALTAWKLAGHQPLPALHIACCGLAPQAKLADWVALAGDSDKLQRGMERLYKLFEQAPVLGSLINPRLGGGDLLEADFHELQPLLEQAMEQEAGDEAAHEMAVTAQGLAKAAEILSGRFTLVATNVPYLGHGSQDEPIKEQVVRYYPEGKSDLAAAFQLRAAQSLSDLGALALVTPEGWLYKDYYGKLRKRIIQESVIRSVLPLGPGAFEEISGEEVKPQLWISEQAQPTDSNYYSSIDARHERGPSGKLALLLNGCLTEQNQRAQLENPKATINFSSIDRTSTLHDYVSYHNGIQAGDLNRFTRSFSEIPVIGSMWEFIQTTTDESHPFSGMTSIFQWENNIGAYRKYVEERLGKGGVNAWIRGVEMQGEDGLLISASGELKAALFSGRLFDDNTVALKVSGPERAAVWAFASSGALESGVRAFDTSRKVRGAIVRVPFDLGHWQKVAAEKYPDGLPKPHSDDPTQWLFSGHPAGSEQPLQVAVARLLGYRWPRQTGSSFPDCPALGPDGLEAFADEDGIVCLPALNQEAPAADRLRKLLDQALGENEWNEQQLISATGSKKTDLASWLRDDFFTQHCKLFHHRPFIWHLWDGRPDGFHALVNYHQLAAPNGAGYKLLEKLTYAYLGDWIRRQQADHEEGKPGAEDRLEAAQLLQQELKHILAGEPPYDLFVRWKPLHEQAIGWHPDLNDGVRLNSHPFVKARDVKQKHAGLFRAKFNVKWTKDRGKEPQRDKADFPWFWTWDESTQDFTGTDEFDGNRWNDLHYTTAVKQAARNRKEQES